MLLRPMIPADSEECAYIAGLAFQNDRHTQLKTRMRREPYDHTVGMKDALRHWFQQPEGKLEMTVAVDEESDNIVGWVVWNLPSFDQNVAKEQSLELMDGIATSANTIESTARIDQSLDSPTKPLVSARAKLEAYTGADLTKWIKTLMPPRVQCMYINSIVVHPHHQGRGIGAALVRKGTYRADAEGVFCWVHASEGAVDFFKNQAFQEVGRLELDLDAWNEENVQPPEGPEAIWGHYIFHYMKRDPRITK